MRPLHALTLIALASLSVHCGGAETSPDETAANQAAPLQHQNANAHQWWNLPTTAWNVDQRVVAQAVSNASYFSTTVFFADVDYGAYMGFQQLGDGQRIARFSVWNATEFDGASCRPFDGEGIGTTCELPFGFETGRWYTFRMWRLSKDESGAWWGAWIIDDQGTEFAIGNIKAPAAAGDIAAIDSFNEYFGDAVSCEAVPYGAAWFLAPSLNGGEAAATFGDQAVGACSGGRVTPTIYGTSLLELGQYGG